MVVRDGFLPNNLSHSMIQSLSSLPVTGGPSMGSPRSTGTSCNVTIISPTLKWNVDVLGLLSIKAVSKGQSSLTYFNWEVMKNSAHLTYSMTQSSAKTHSWCDREWSKHSMIWRSYSFAYKLRSLWHRTLHPYYHICEQNVGDPTTF